jgi:phosphatidate cytidylyltransferase
MTRILSAVILIPAALLVVIFAHPLVYLIGIAVIGTLCLYEYSGLMHAMSIPTRPWFLYGMFWALLAIIYLDASLLIPVLPLTLIAAFTASLGRTGLPVRDRAFGLLAELFGILYMALFLYPALGIRYEFTEGLQWTLLMLLVIWGGDTFALVVGKKFGKSPLAPKLSPKKTKEGALAGLFAGTVIAVAFRFSLAMELPLFHVVVVSIVLGIFGQLGDLAESMIKRAAGIKDSSHLIPGHGGVLDRMDSLLFSLPVLYAYLLIFGV